MGEATHETGAAYDAIAPTYAERWFGSPVQVDLEPLASVLEPGAPVLDVGCGPGHDAARLAVLGLNVVGIDFSSEMLREGCRRGIGVPLVRGDMRRLPFRAGSFRGLWVCASFLHIPPEDALAVLQELARVVRPGHMMLSVKQGQGVEWVPEGTAHRRFFVYYERDELCALVERAGFRVLSCRETEDLAGRKRPWIGVLARCGG